MVRFNTTALASDGTPMPRPAIQLQQMTHAPEFKLDGIPSTLLIPLVARAFGDEIFPGFAVGDAHAAQALALLEVDVAPFLRDKASVFGVLSRTRLFRQLGHESKFIECTIDQCRLF